MENMNLQITLNHSPFYDNLLMELQSVAEQKKKILRKVKKQEDIKTILNFDERKILEHLIKKENEILLTLIDFKGWSVKPGRARRKATTSSYMSEDRDYYRPEFYNY